MAPDQSTLFNAVNLAFNRVMRERQFAVTELTLQARRVGFPRDRAVRPQRLKSFKAKFSHDRAPLWGSNGGGENDFHSDPRICHLHHAATARRCVIGIDPAIPDIVHFGIIGHILQPNRRAENLAPVAASFGQELVNAGERLARLLADIAVEIIGNLASEMQHTIVHDDAATPAVGIDAADFWSRHGHPRSVLNASAGTIAGGAKLVIPGGSPR